MTRPKMEQDDLEEELFYHSIFGHLQLLVGLFQSSEIYRSVYEAIYRKEALYILFSLLVVFFSLIRYDRQGRLVGWVRGVTSCCALVNSFYVTDPEEKGVLEWSEVTSNCVIYSMQGRRPANEDRAVACTVVTETGDVNIFAVMDGHGGQFAVNFAKKHLLSSLQATIKQLKLVTSQAAKSEKISKYEQNFGKVPECVKTYLGVSEAEYKQLSPHHRKEEKKCSTKLAEKSSQEPPKSETEISDGNKDGKDCTVSEEDTATKVGSGEDSSIARSSLVNSRPTQSLEELPTPKTPKAPNRILVKPRKTPKLKLKSPSEVLPELTDYIDSAGEILYAKIIKDEILKCDKNLIAAAKKANAIGGSTLLLTILDGGTFWVANVGDSRGVFCSEGGHAIPLSFDHKPCQLKEKRRIQEAGGFVSLNGVWRVQGVLATSRALGDYPLKEKKVVVADPDVLSFSVKEHKMNFAVLASDGLWDTHSNEEVTEILRTSNRDLLGVRNLASDSYTRGSTDNITILVIKF